MAGRKILSKAIEFFIKSIIKKCYICGALKRACIVKNMTKQVDYTSINKHNFEKIYRKYFPRKLCFVQRYVLNKEDIENIIHDVFEF